MTSITKATENDIETIVRIGLSSVWEAHKDSCPAQDMDEYLKEHYNDDEIKKELSDPNNIYHLLYYNGQPAGFSKIVLNAAHPDIGAMNTTKLDRIYLLKEFYGLKLGLELLNFNIGLAKQNGQSGIWLYTWTGNTRAIDFYLKAGFKIIDRHSFQVSKTHANPNHHMYLDL